MLNHHDIWGAIDRLAERNGLSASGLAKKAGLSSTLFNPSKRATSKRKRWPSTESIAAILHATNTTLDDFVALVSPLATQHTRLPLLDTNEAARINVYDATTGFPLHKRWDEMSLPAGTDPDAFALEIIGKNFEPAYHEGDRIIISPAEKPRRGDRVAILTRDSEILLKQLGREGAQKIELLAFQPDAPPTTLDRLSILWLHRITWASQ